MTDPTPTKLQLSVSAIVDFKMKDIGTNADRGFTDVISDFLVSFLSAAVQNGNYDEKTHLITRVFKVTDSSHLADWGSARDFISIPKLTEMYKTNISTGRVQPLPVIDATDRKLCLELFAALNELEYYNTISSRPYVKASFAYYATMCRIDPNYENKFNFIETRNGDESTDLNKATFSYHLVEQLIWLYASDSALIYDPFMGTGTTAVGCVRQKRRWMGSELSEKQCDHANKRLELYLAQESLF